MPLSNLPPLKILIVDDDVDTRHNLGDILEMDGFAVESAGTAREVLARTDWSGISAVILDRQLPDGSGEALLPKLKQRAPQADVIIVTGHTDLQGAIAAVRAGASDYILKPIDADALRTSLARITERKRLALEKERSEQNFRALVDAAPCMIVILRADRTITYFSSFAEELTGYAAEEVLGRDYVELFVPEDHRTAVAKRFGQVLGGVPLRAIEESTQCRDGTRRWIIWNATPLPHYDGGNAVLAVGQDITSLKQAQERALQSERLAAIGQMMTGLAHESGNALARSQACIEMLALEVEDRPAALDLIARIQKAQDHLRHLYEEVRGYAAPLRLERENVDVGAVCRQAWEHLAIQRQGKQAEFAECCEGVDCRCSIDPFRLEQVFRNILENALAACPEPVRIELACAPAALYGKPALRVAVRDNGPGLSPEQRARIFDPFFTTKTKGTGLGMAIAKRIVEAHGGHIAVGNNAGAPQAGGAARGAEIVITLPRESP